MQITTLPVGLLQANCYIISKDNACLIIDPGADYLKIKQALTNLKPLAVLLTHSHSDHIGALRQLINDYNIPVYKMNNLTETTIQIKPFIFEVIYTNGHSNDSVSYYFKDDNIIFTGDFLFKHDIGRCDLPTGSWLEMQQSIIKIKKLNNGIEIYPGHGEKTTLKDELQNNEYLH